MERCHLILIGHCICGVFMHIKLKNVSGTQWAPTIGNLLCLRLSGTSQKGNKNNTPTSPKLDF